MNFPYFQYKRFVRFWILVVGISFMIIGGIIWIKSIQGNSQSVTTNTLSIIFGVVGVITSFSQAIFAVFPHDSQPPPLVSSHKLAKGISIAICSVCLLGIILALVIPDRFDTLAPLSPRTPGATRTIVLNATLSPMTVTSVVSSTTTPVLNPTSTSAPYGGMYALDDPLQNNNAGRWDANEGCRFIGSGYQINATNFYHECADNSDDFSNDAFQVKIILTQGSSGGIEFRRSANTSYYSFSIGWSGQYEFLKVDSKQNITPVFQGRILQDSQLTYKLGIVANKSHFEFYINNVMVRSLTDNTYSDGSLFLFVDGSNEARTPATQAIFSGLKVWQF